MHALEEKFLYIFAFLPVSPGVAMPWLLTFVIASVCWFLTRNISDDSTARSQHTLEYIYENLESFVVTIVGEEHSKQLMPILSTIFIYLLFSNLLGLVPGLKSPTGILSNCLGISLIIFCYTQYLGLKNHGLGYIKHFSGTIWWMMPLLLPIHLIGEISRPISLTLRLFGNIMGEDAVILVLTVFIFPLLVPVPMLLMSVFTSLLQALVFTILSGVYLSGAISEGH